MVKKQIITGLTPAMVQTVVLDLTGTTLPELNGRSRKPRLSFPRHLMMWATYKFTPATLKEVGYMLNRDHSSVIYGCKQIEYHIEFDKTYQRTISAAVRRLL